MKRPALGKGIGALLGPNVQEQKGPGGSRYFLCPIENLKPHGQQPRKTFDDARLAELAASIREKGVIQPLVVRHLGDHYQIIAGERRWRAAQKAGLRELPVVIQDVSEESAMEMALIENIQREDLNPLEEAAAYRQLMDSFTLSQDDVAKRVGKDRSTVANALRLLRLPAPVRLHLEAGELSMGHARALLSLETDDDMVEAATEVIRRRFSVRETEALVKKIKNFVGGKPVPKAAPSRETWMDRLEEDLKAALGTNAKLHPKGRGGRLEIHYTSTEELDRLLERLGVS